MLNKIKITLQHLLPKYFLTKLAGWGAEYQGGFLTYAMVALFIRIYKVNIQEAQNTNITDYPTFNTFFVRSLRDNARPINTDPNVLIFPADGIISQLGSIKEEQIFQAKGHYYSLAALLAGYPNIINHFRNGRFTTTYLAPRDYHRVHMPCNGVLREMIYVPGNLFPLNPFSTKNISNLFARNERVICLFETSFGPMAQILIGTIIVGSIETVWFGVITPPREGIIKRWRYPEANATDAVVLLKGQEMGRFKLGSTVINLFCDGRVLLDHHLYARYITRVGQPLARGIITQTESYSVL